jgi:predicted  nucleic acid-binding Zn-ribbon protein
VSVESFFKLKEIASLTNMRINQLKAKYDQEDRLSKLNKRRATEDLQTVKLKQELISLYAQIAEMEIKLKTASEQKQRMIDHGGDEKKIFKFSQEIESLETNGFELMEKADDFEREISAKKVFISGLDATISEIQQEVDQEISKANKEIENLELRLKLILEELPSDFRSLLERVSSKNLAHGPFTRIDQGSCFFCRYKISRVEESEIDMQKGLKTCSQCGRIFLPYGAS